MTWGRSKDAGKVIVDWNCFKLASALAAWQAFTTDSDEVFWRRGIQTSVCLESLGHSVTVQILTQNA